MNDRKNDKILGSLKVYGKIPKSNKLMKEKSIKKTKNFLQNTLLVLFSGAVIISSIPIAGALKETIYLKQYGVSTKDAIYASIDSDYVQPEIRTKINELDKILEQRFPNIKFHDSGNVVLSSENWKSPAGELDQLAGFYNGIEDVAVLNTNFPQRYAHENFHRRTRHFVITEDGKKEEYGGLKRLSDGKGQKLNEALTTYIEKELYNSDTSYFEYRYLELILNFISIDDIVKIAAEGSIQDLENLFEPYFDCDIISLIDNSPGVNDILYFGPAVVIEKITNITNEIINAFYNYIDNSDIPENEKEEKIKKFGKYLEDKFPKNVNYFNQMFESYIKKGISK